MNPTIAKRIGSTFSVVLPAIILLLFASVARASLSVEPEANLQPPDVTFSEVAVGTPLDGLTINGFTFAESIPGNSLVGGAGAGPGNTNHITQPSGVSLANPPGDILTITLPGRSSAFGFAYAILAGGVVANGVTITLFDGAANLGFLTYGASPDPIFPGGFAGIHSTIPFTSAQLAFSPLAVAWDIDNVSAIAAVPEPSPLALLGAAWLAGLLLLRRRAS